MTDLRCASKLHGTLDDGVIEIKCNSRFCGAGSEVVVLHKFNAVTGELIETARFKSPGGTRGTDHRAAAVRTA